MERTNLDQLMIESAERGLSMQQKNGAMPAGNNGPWNDTDTPVRNTSHWGLIFLEAHKLTEDDRYLDALNRAMTYLLSEEARPYGATFYCRNSTVKDQCNGLIGQAWVLKTLLIAGEYLKNGELLKAAVDVFEQHEFEKQYGLWRIRHIDGSLGGICLTFNQQIWFAVVAGMLSKYCQHKLAKQQLNIFLDKFHTFFRMTKKGRIYHTIGNPRIKGFLKRVYMYWLRNKQSEKLFELEIGYHSFNLYAFALLYEIVPDHMFWKRISTIHSLQRILSYTNEQEFLSNADHNHYAYAYNPAGFEIAYFIDVFSDFLEFSDKHAQMEYWIHLQLDKHFNPNTRLMDKDTLDERTLASRIYEVIGIRTKNRLV